MQDQVVETDEEVSTDEENIANDVSDILSRIGRKLADVRALKRQGEIHRGRRKRGSYPGF